MKLIASDYDGTFFTTPEQLERNIQAVKLWKKAGHTFGIITGRSMEMVEAVLKQYHISVDFLVCNSGASIYTGYGELRDTATIKSDKLESMLSLKEMQKSFHHIFITTNGSYAKILSPLSWVKGKEFKLPLVDSYEEVSQFPLIQISTCFQTKEAAAACAEAVDRLYSSEVCANLNQDCVDIAPVGINKRVGIKKLLCLLPDQYEQILTIGDGENDLPMIKYYKGATVPGASAMVKEQAGVVYDSLEDMIKKYL